MMNNISVIGRLVADPEQREYNGRNVTNFVLASDSSARNSDGNFITNFYRVSAWGNASDTIYKYSKKGDLLGVCGSFSTREYSSKDDSRGKPMNTKPILRIRKNYRFVMQWAIFSNSYLSTLVKRKMLFPKIYCC